MKLVPIGLIGLVIALIAVVSIADSRNPTRSDPPVSYVATTATTVPHFQTEAVREVLFTDEATVSRGVGPVLVQLHGGTIPADVTRLTVLTDEDCTPEKDGVSHCTNRVEFVSAHVRRTAVIKHHHKMSEEPCLSPGEVVVIAA